MNIRPGQTWLLRFRDGPCCVLVLRHGETWYKCLILLGENATYGLNTGQIRSFGDTIFIGVGSLLSEAEVESSS